MESELFGYEPGAFTDAKKRKIGLIELAQNGTLFLDEISEMSPSLQAKLLRVIENRVFKRLGGIRDIKVTIRIVAATNRDIKSFVEQEKFREDLFFRLNMFHLKLPSLAERKDEILLIAQFFLEKLARKLQRPIKRITEEAQQMILKSSWPGNIRQLHNTIERAVILCEGNQIETEHLACEMMKENQEKNNSTPILSDLQDRPLKEYIENLEESLLQQALQVSNGNQLKASKILNEPRHIVRYLVKKHSL